MKSVRFRKFLKDRGKAKTIPETKSIEIERILALLWRPSMDICL